MQLSKPLWTAEKVLKFFFLLTDLAVLHCQIKVMWKIACKLLKNFNVIYLSVVLKLLIANSNDCNGLCAVLVCRD